MPSPIDLCAYPRIRQVPLLPQFMIALVFGACSFAVLHSGAWNADAFAAVQSVTIEMPDTFWAMATICGTGLVAFALLSLCLPKSPRFFAAGLVSGALAWAYSYSLKHLFALPRPAAVLEPNQIHIIGVVLRVNAFPSGHAITAFTAASLLVFMSPRRGRVLLWVLPAALVVALSRIAVGAHWPADVTLGAAGGWLCGAVGSALTQQWQGWNTEQGARMFGAICVGVGIALFFADLGYPLALPLQYVAGTISVLAGIYALARPEVDRVVPVARHER